MSLKLYITFLLLINLISIVVTSNTINFTLLTQTLLSITNVTNDSFINIEPAALFEYQFMCVITRDSNYNEIVQNKKGLLNNADINIVDEVYAKKVMCGGAIIHEDWVLTVARCLRKEVNLTAVRIYAGIIDMYRLEGQQARSIKSISIHPRFNNSSNEYNIAMLKVSSSFIITKYVNRVRLSSQPMIPTGLENCYTLKFLRGMDIANRSITKLYKVQRRVLAQLECGDRLQLLKAFNRQISKNNFCLVSHNDQNNYSSQLQGACERDTGNPCICGYHIQGLISFATSETCYESSYPTTISDVGCHLNWIRGQILQLKIVPKQSSSKIIRSKITVVFFIILLHLKIKM